MIDANTLKSASHLLKKFFFLFASMIALQNDEKCFLFLLFISLFIVKIFKLLPWLFGQVERTVWLER